MCARVRLMIKDWIINWRVDNDDRDDSHCLIRLDTCAVIKGFYRQRNSLRKTERRVLYHRVHVRLGQRNNRGLIASSVLIKEEHCQFVLQWRYIASTYELFQFLENLHTRRDEQFLDVILESFLRDKKIQKNKIDKKLKDEKYLIQLKL